MNTLKLQLLYSYWKTKMEFSWHDILFGIYYNFFEKKTIIDFAIEQLLKGSNDELDIEIAGLNIHSVDNLLDFYLHLLYEKYPEATMEEQIKNRFLYRDLNIQEEKMIKRFLYMSLKYLYDNQSMFDSPLGDVAVIWDDFGYPQEIRNLIYYMPATEESLPMKELNTQQLFLRWKKYIDEWQDV